jgi:predicted transcriptional regulator
MVEAFMRQQPRPRTRDAEAEAVAAIFPGTRAEAVAAGRADAAAGRVYSAEAMAQWMNTWNTPDETEHPGAEWRDGSRLRGP